jgi:hypothetical protein
VFRLAPDRFLPRQPQPPQVLHQGLGELRPTSSGVDVLYAQKEAATGAPGGLKGGEGGKGVPAM